MSIRTSVLGVAAVALALGLVRRTAAADCARAQTASPIDSHYTLNVENHCKTPVVLAVCWRWPGNAESRHYRLSRAGNVIFLGPEVVAGDPGSAIWLRCATGKCTIACAKSAASTTAPAPVASTPPTTSQPQPPPTQWGAIAAGIDPAGTEGHVGVGWAIGDSQATAQTAALAQCRKQGISSCQIVTIYNEGCGYITTGNNGSGAYGWGSGATAARALATCSSQGFICQKPIGGCVK